MKTKICTKCQEVKPLDKFYKQGERSDGTPRFCSQCKVCQLEYKSIHYRKNKNKKSEYNKLYRKKNKEYLNQQNNLYREQHIEELKEYQKKYREIHKEESKIYQKEYRKTYDIQNKDKYLEYRRQYDKNRRENDVCFKLGNNISRSLRSSLTNNFIRKNSQTYEILLELGYTIGDLKIHLEHQFEDWMSWENYGPYKKSMWNDKDKSTWTWSIDHIIPQSVLKFNSLDHPNFKYCWSLENLRPLSSKINQLDGCTRKRHKK